MAFYFLAIGFISLVFSFLAAPALRVYRQQVSRRFYWSFMVLWAPLLYSGPTFILGLLLFKLWIVVGVYSELEYKFSIRPYLNIALSAAVSTIFVALLGIGLSPFFGSQIGELLNESLGPLLKSSVGDLLPVSPLSLIPSLLFFLSLSNIVFAIALDRRFADFLNQPLSIPANHPRFLDFRAPDLMIWPFLLAVLGSFVRGVPEWVLIPSLNIALGLSSIYFFQGLSVVEQLLYAIRAGLLVRILVYVLLVGQMFFLLVGIGLVDFWIDIRYQFTKRFRK